MRNPPVAWAEGFAVTLRVPCEQQEGAGPSCPMLGGHICLHVHRASLRRGDYSWMRAAATSRRGSSPLNYSTLAKRDHRSGGTER